MGCPLITSQRANIKTHICVYGVCILYYFKHVLKHTVNVICSFGSIYTRVGVKSMGEGMCVCMCVCEWLYRRCECSFPLCCDEC